MTESKSNHGTSSKSKPKQAKRWECHNVSLIAVRVDEAEWEFKLAAVAELLYLLNHQLQDHPANFYSLIHPLHKIQNRNGETHGKEPIKQAA